jgi:hypothetical protein
MNSCLNGKDYIFFTSETQDIIGTDNRKGRKMKKHKLLQNLAFDVCTLFSAVLYTMGHMVV